MAAILFVCRHNACRSQIAEAIGRKLAPESWIIESAGSHPTTQVDPKAAGILRRYCLGMHRGKPQGFSALTVKEWDFVVDISCEKAAKDVPTKHYFEWDLQDPQDGPMDLYKCLFDDLEDRIRTLFREVQTGSDSGKNRRRN